MINRAFDRMGFVVFKESIIGLVVTVIVFFDFRNLFKKYWSSVEIRSRDDVQALNERLIFEHADNFYLGSCVHHRMTRGFVFVVHGGYVL